MDFKVLTALLLIALLGVVVESRDPDVDDESYETEVLSYCPKREEWWRCATGCEKSCTHPRQPKPCNRKCIPYACVCKKGYYRDNQGTGRCVLRKECKKWGPGAQ